MELVRPAAPQALGYTLIVQLSRRRNVSQVFELDADGQRRWQIDSLNFVIDAQVLPGNRVLLAENQAGRVGEWNFAGRLLWHLDVPEPIACQRLVNGHTVVVTPHLLLEVDRAGDPVFTHRRPEADLIGARRLPDGRSVLLLGSGSSSRCLFLDARGKPGKTFPVASLYQYTRFDVLPGDHLLVPSSGQDKVVEYAADGQPVWQAAVDSPTSAVRLPNGHTLVDSQGDRRVLELDRQGNEVWQYYLDRRGQPWRVNRR
jgi:hypothetical protein